MILSKLDKDRDRKLSRQEWAGEEAASQQGLLLHADADGDGFITELELTRSLNLRDEIRTIEERAKGSMRPAPPNRTGTAK
jgi:hypothetical protein